MLLPRVLFRTIGEIFYHLHWKNKKPRFKKRTFRVLTWCLASVMLVIFFWWQFDNLYLGAKHRIKKIKKIMSARISEMINISPHDDKSIDEMIVQRPVVDESNGMSSQHFTNQKIYTRLEFLNLYEKIKIYIANKKINDALYLQNQLLFSKSDFVFKEKIKMLGQAIPMPSLEQFQNTLGYDDLMSDPYAENLYVKWRGKFLQVPTPQQIERLNHTDKQKNLWLTFSFIASHRKDEPNKKIKVLFPSGLPLLKVDKEYLILGRLRKENLDKKNSDKVKTFLEMASLKEVNANIFNH